MLFAGCNSLEDKDSAIITCDKQLRAGFAEDTRTYVENDKYLRWHEDDRLSAFYGNTLNREYKFNGATGDNSGTFSLVPSGELGTGNNFDCIYALYPYDTTARISDEGVISLTLPATQNYAENSFGKGANTMIAVTENLEDTFLAFKNACGYLKIKLYNADGSVIKSIELKGNNCEKIAGAATATIAFGEAPIVTMTDDATDTITLDCGNGVTLGTTAETASELWIVMPETTFEEGFTITATDINGGSFEKSTSNAVTITRNDIQPMAAVEVVIEASNPNLPDSGTSLPANNEIWYTNNSTTEPICLYNTDGFGANFLSQFYDTENDCWVILFDGDVTSIGEAAFVFSGCTSLTSITIPQSVISVSPQSFMGCSNLKKFIGKYASEDGHCLIVDGVLKGIACAGLSEYRLPEEVSSVGDRACCCTWFESFERLIIPGTVVTIGEGAFEESWYLKEIVLEDGVKTIGDYAFSCCNSLDNIVIPNSIMSIGSEWVAGSDGVDVFIYAEIPPAIKSNTFRYKGVNIYIPAKSISNYTNYSYYDDDKKGWNDLQSCIKGSIEQPIYNNAADIANNEIRYQTVDGCIFAPFFSDETDWGANIIAHRYNETLGCWVILFDGEVEQVADNAYFNYCYSSSRFLSRQSSLTNIILPSSITRIGKEAFLINPIHSITIPQNVSIIDDRAFCETYLEHVYCTPIVPPTLGEKVFSSDTDIIMVEQIHVPSASEAQYKRQWLTYASYIFPYDF